MPEQNTFGAYSYILIFFRDIEMLTDNQANYNNQILKLKQKYGAVQGKKLIETVEGNDVTNLEALTDDIRFWSSRVFTKLTALKQKKGLEELGENYSEIEEAFNHIRDTTVPDVKIVQDYAIKLNALFVTEIGQELLIKSQEHYAQMQQINDLSGGANSAD